MIDEIKKSINSNLYERTRSPLYGTIILSWCVWNWKAIYYIFVVDSKTPVFTRIDCLQNDLTTKWTLYWGPLISTLAILLVFEYVANYAYWLHLLHKTWRTNKKFETEGKQLLSYEQSLKLRGDIRRKEEEYEKLIQEKENSIKELEDYIKILGKEKDNKTESTELTNTDVQKNKIDLIYKKLKDEDKLVKYKNICAEILNGNSILSTDIDVKYFVTIGLMAKGSHSLEQKYYYKLTPEGKQLHDMLIFN